MIPDENHFRGKDRRYKERKYRRELILRAAERVFGRHPFHEATMQLVAAEAELGMQGVYEHFPSKQALYEEVILFRARSFQARLAKAVGGFDAPLEQLREVARIRIEAYFEAPAFLPVFLAELLRFDWGISSRTAPSVHGVFRKVQAELAGILSRAVASGDIKPIDPLLLQHLFMSTINGVLRSLGTRSEAASDLRKEDIPRCVNLVMDTYLNGVSPSGES